jgi:hypothetical protein
VLVDGLLRSETPQVFLGVSKVMREYWSWLSTLLLYITLPAASFVSVQRFEAICKGVLPATVTQGVPMGLTSALVQLKVKALGSAFTAEHDILLLSVPVHVQFHGPDPETGDAMPTEHKLAGAEIISVPLSEPHTPVVVAMAPALPFPPLPLPEGPVAE